MTEQNAPVGQHSDGDASAPAGTGEGSTAAGTADLTPRERSQQVRAARQKRFRRRMIALGSFILVFALVITLITVGLRQLLGMNDIQSYAGPGEQEVTFTVPQGAATSQIFSDLRAKDIIASETGFAKTFNEQSGGAQIQPGEYKLKTKMSNEQVVKILIGNDLTKVFYVPISGNMRITEVTQTLSKYTRIPLEQFEKLVNDPAKFDVSSKAKNLEGYLAPGEYRFPLDATPEEMVRQMVETQKDILEKGGVTGKDAQYTMLIKASIVEAEGNPKNYRIIAGALNNRVERPNEDTGGYINSDATVTYGLKSRTLHISDAQKRDTSNKYNTYANKGLPIGPIGSPDKAALEATMNPDKNDYYYWVTIDIKTGETLYARTYEEHQVNEKKYLQYCADNPNVCQ